MKIKKSFSILSLLDSPRIFAFAGITTYFAAIFEDALSQSSTFYTYYKGYQLLAFGWMSIEYPVLFLGWIANIPLLVLLGTRLLSKNIWIAPKFSLLLFSISLIPYAGLKVRQNWVEGGDPVVLVAQDGAYLWTLSFLFCFLSNWRARSLKYKR
jgi:hypothetical protein